MMMRRLRDYLDWKATLHRDMQLQANPNVTKGTAQSQPVASGSASGESGLNEAMLKKDRERLARLANRRRVRGGGPVTNQRTQSSEQEGLMKNEGVMIEEAEKIADL